MHDAVVSVNIFSVHCNSCEVKFIFCEKEIKFEKNDIILSDFKTKQNIFFKFSRSS